MQMTGGIQWAWHGGTFRKALGSRLEGCCDRSCGRHDDSSYVVSCLDVGRKAVEFQSLGSNSGKVICTTALPLRRHKAFLGNASDVELDFKGGRLTTYCSANDAVFLTALVPPELPHGLASHRHPVGVCTADDVAVQFSGDDPGRCLSGSAVRGEHLLQFAVEFFLREFRRLPKKGWELRASRAHENRCQGDARGHRTRPGAARSAIRNLHSRV